MTEESSKPFVRGLVNASRGSHLQSLRCEGLSDAYAKEMGAHPTFSQRFRQEVDSLLSRLES
jgi:hypothetical protein